MSTHHTDSPSSAEDQPHSIDAVPAAVSHRLNRPPTPAKATVASRLRATVGRAVALSGVTAPFARAMILHTERRTERHELLHTNADDRRIFSEWLATRFPDAPAWRHDLVVDRLLERHVTIVMGRIVVKDGYGAELYRGWATRHDRRCLRERHLDVDPHGRTRVKDGFGRIISPFPEIAHEDLDPADVTRSLFADDPRTAPR